MAFSTRKHGPLGWSLTLAYKNLQGFRGIRSMGRTLKSVCQGEKNRGPKSRAHASDPLMGGGGGLQGALDLGVRMARVLGFGV